MLIYKYFNWNKVVIFQLYFHLKNCNYENMFTSLLVTIGGSNDIYICLFGQWSWEHCICQV